MTPKASRPATGPVKRHMIAWGIYSITCFVLASTGYWLLYPLLPEHEVFLALPRMIPYHQEHPHQYIALVAVFYGFFASTWSGLFGHWRGIRRPISIVLMMLFTLALVSPIGGMLWVLHDMQAGFVPPGPQFRLALSEGANLGLRLGWFIVAFPTPFNLLGLIAGYVATDRIQRRLSPCPDSGNSAPAAGTASGTSATPFAGDGLRNGH